MRNPGCDEFSYRVDSFRGGVARHLQAQAQVRQRWLPHLLCLALLLCHALPAYAGNASGTLAGSTFINSGQPNNNNGGVGSIYTGNDSDGGSLRGLVRFTLPAALNERATITSVIFSLPTTAPVVGPPTAATVSLHRLTQSWGQGTGGAADFTGDFTLGQACSAGGATWNQPLCSGVLWTTAGGAVNASVSASASVPATAGSTVTWNSAGLVSDVQAWADVSASNNGWRLLSSTETTFGAVQRFTKAAQLSVSFSCKPAFLEASNTCTTCTAAAKSACVTSQPGNFCLDSGPPSSTYSCSCANAAYALGPGGTSCVDKNECIPNHCADRGDTAAACLDHAAPSTGYSCQCSAGFVVIGGVCDDRIFVSGFDT